MLLNRAFCTESEITPTMVLVTHEMEFAARVADTIIYMHEGKVWETGPGDMLKNPQTAELRDFLSHGL